MDQTSQIASDRNKLLIRLLWVFYLVNAVKFLVDDRPSALVSVLGILLLSVVSVVAWRRANPVLVMYLILGSTSLFSFALMMKSPNFINYLFIWFCLIISAVYQSYTAVVFTGVLSTTQTVFFFHKFGSELIPGSTTLDVIYLLMINCFVTTFLLCMTKFTRKLWMEAENSREQLRYILDNVNIAIWELDAGNGSMQLSAGVEKFTGLTAAAFQRDPGLWKTIVHPEDKGRVLAAYKQARNGRVQGIDLRIIRPDGEVRWLQSRGIPILDGDKTLIGLKGVVIDITERKDMEEKIHFLAYHDVLTELPNRVLFGELAAGTLARSGRDDGCLAIMFFDLNGFKEINDTFGHDVGDLLLKEVAGRLRDSLREADILCRLGGDEFVALLEIRHQDDAKVVAERAAEMFATPFTVNRHERFIDCSMGISLYPAHGLELDVLIRKADAAMYRAKSIGGTGWHLYQETEDTSDTVLE